MFDIELQCALNSIEQHDEPVIRVLVQCIMVLKERVLELEKHLKTIDNKVDDLDHRLTSVEEETILIRECSNEVG